MSVVSKDASSSDNILSRLGKINEIAPTSAYLTERNHYLLPLSGDSEHPLTGHRDQMTIYEAQEDEEVLEFEVFKNYLSMIIEKNG